ncbi:hypothetical protein VTN96DRAFT_2090 [Rasamsonia emersonii]
MSRRCELPKNQLIADLRRLVPDLFDTSGDTSLDLGSEPMRGKIYSSWRLWKRHAEKTSPNTFHKTLLRTLGEQQHRQLKEATSSGDDQPVPPLQHHEFTEACRQLKESIEGERVSASFACGGTIPIRSTSMAVDESSTRRTSLPVHIFWTKEKNSNNARRLLWKGRPGCAGPELSKGRQAGSGQFASSFNPADFGILENIEQILLPNVSTDLVNSLQFRMVTADLYKLNAYSGPSGHFRKHVDTPRSPSQIGSLVVCLPSPFKGGNLIVRHHGQEVDFDWSLASASTIQWAAFYSDCEHEIKTITEEDRITLTYNLYVTEPVGSAISRSPIVEPQTLPLYGYIRDMTKQRWFMEDGGVLGIFCSHAYAHNSDVATESLPRALKGFDLVLYSIFKSLGYEVDILPVIEPGGDYDTTNPQLGLEGSVLGKRKWDYISTDRYDESPPYLEHGQTLEQDYERVLDGDFRECDDVEKRWKTLLYARHVKGKTDMAQTAQEKGLTEIVDSYSRMARVGKWLKPYSTTDRGEDEDIDEVARQVWPFSYLPGITWLTGPKHEEMAFSQIVYGNEAGIGTRYSCDAIFVIIPPWEKRAQLSWKDRAASQG